MKVELFPFQKIALNKLRMYAAIALGNYHSTHAPQIISYTAPTGAGKTIIMASLIESILFGDEQFPDQNDAIFVWLSDSPQLNEQSKQKIDLKADKIRLDQCVTIEDDSFDREVLEDGHIYFLNTQKLGKSSNLTKHSDARQYTIWETLANTVRDKSDRLYFIIDEAHRGAKSDRELASATTIMQKFIFGSPADRLPPMPVVIGMTATSARFNRLAQGTQSTTHYVRTEPEEVRASGLLKDRIVITYPETKGNDMAVLQAAADEWKNKWQHWEQYCSEQHYAQVYPIFVVQVENGSANRLSNTDLDDCLHSIEERIGYRFTEGQVVHAFGDTNAMITVNGLNVPYAEPSRINDDKRIRLVFFKETLSTGWDCPRAETMMSFRRANDHTYVAQLLGRMVRTPTQQHINVDDTLNDVHLYLPQFNASTVYDVVEALQSTEGANIPTDVEAEELGSNTYDTLTLQPTYQIPPRKSKQKTNVPGQISAFNDSPPIFSDLDGNSPTGIPTPSAASTASTPGAMSVDTNTSAAGTMVANTPEIIPSKPAATPTTVVPSHMEQQTAQPISVPNSTLSVETRRAVAKAINDAGLLTYNVRKVHTYNGDYLKSLYALARFLTQTRLDMDAKDTVIAEIVEMIHQHIERLKSEGLYEDLAGQVLQFKLNAQIFDVFGRSIDNYSVHDILATTDADIERQFRLAELRLGHEGVGNAYGKKYYNDNDPVAHRIDIIIFAADLHCMEILNAYAKDKFHEMNDAYRRQTVMLPERLKKKYDDIVSDGDIVSKHNFRIPEKICVPHETDGELYSDHLFVDDSGTCMINLNGWEKKVIAEEEQQEDFVCWLRNPPRGSWSLCVPYDADSEKKPMYPDFLIIRRDGNEYIVDILEPHNPAFIDNLGKAKGLAEYARQNPGVGRIQLIRMKQDTLGNEKPYRLDMSKSSIREKVLHCTSTEELNHVFEENGFFID